MGLVLSRKKGDQITLIVEPSEEQTEIKIWVNRLDKSICKLAFDAPQSVDIQRHDIVKPKMPRYGELAEAEDANDYRIETARDEFEMEMRMRDFNDRGR